MENFPHLHDKLETGIQREASYGSITLDLESKTVTSSVTHLHEKLGPNEYQILWLFVRAQGATLSRTEIEEFVYETYPEERDIPLGNSFDVYLKNIRRKLDVITNGAMTIENIHGVGWYLKTI